MTTLIEIQGLSVSIDSQQLLHGIDLRVSRGEIVTIIGPNGAGKTTLIRAAMGLQNLSGGSITRAPGLRIGYVPQRFSFDGSIPLTVDRFLRLTPGVTGETAATALAEVGATNLQSAQVIDLSGGETQRILLARALLRRPGLLVLDEPTQGVDFAGEQALYQLISDLRDRLNCGVLMVSHDLHVVMGATDQVICLNRHVCCTGHPSEVSSHESYLDLFGPNAGQTLAVYHHHHDHEHGLDGRELPPAGDGDTP